MSQIIIRIIADGTLIPLVLFGTYLLIAKVPRNLRVQVYSRILMAGLTAYLLAKLLGFIYQPSYERPFELMGVAAGASFLNNPGFPSDHALFASAITWAVWFATKQKVPSLIMAGLTIVLCVGRVLALVHTPIDVVGGVVIASVGALWYLNDAPYFIYGVILHSQQK
jgi:undecaprenyl-diphosphatase